MRFKERCSCIAKARGHDSLKEEKRLSATQLLCIYAWIQRNTKYFPSDYMFTWSMVSPAFLFPTERVYNQHWKLTCSTWSLWRKYPLKKQNYYFHCCPDSHRPYPFFFPVFWVSLPNFFPLIYISVTHLSLQSILSFSSRMPNSHFVALEMEAKKLVSASGMVKFHQDNYLSILVNPHSGAGFEKASLANCKCWETEASCQEQNLLPYRTYWKRRREKKGLPLSAQVPFCLVPKACF